MKSPWIEYLSRCTSKTVDCNMFTCPSESPVTVKCLVLVHWQEKGTGWSRGLLRHSSSWLVLHEEQYQSGTCMHSHLRRWLYHCAAKMLFIRAAICSVADNTWYWLQQTLHTGWLVTQPFYSKRGVVHWLSYNSLVYTTWKDSVNYGSCHTLPSQLALSVRWDYWLWVECSEVQQIPGLSIWTSIEHHSTQERQFQDSYKHFTSRLSLMVEMHIMTVGKFLATFYTKELQ